MSSLRNIIFDLGGVIINLDIGKTHAAFQALVGEEAHRQIHSTLHEDNIYNRFETGELGNAQFINRMQELAPIAVSDEQVCLAWNAMLLDIPTERLRNLESLSKTYRLYLLSNTNDIHLQAVKTYLRLAHGIADFDSSFFIKNYYSHLMGCRKPDVAIYQQLLQDANLRPEETLFIDDNELNIAGAQAAGLRAVLHPTNTDFMPTLQPYLLL